MHRVMTEERTEKGLIAVKFVELVCVLCNCVCERSDNKFYF